MHLYRVKNCCFCFNLRTGALILGWMGAIFSPIAMISTIVMLNDFQNAAENPDYALDAIGSSNSNDINVLYGKETLKLKFETQPGIIMKFTYFVVILTVIFIIFFPAFQVINVLHIVTCAVIFVSSVILLVGVYKRKEKFIFQWIVTLFACLILVVVTQAIQVRIIPERGRGIFIITTLIVDLIGLGKFHITVIICKALISQFNFHQRFTQNEKSSKTNYF